MTSLSNWHAEFGMHATGSVTLLVAVHTYPRGEEADVARIIGARKATSHERRGYEAEAS
jgi:uncharacterized DUF497 family protein